MEIEREFILGDREFNFLSKLMTAHTGIVLSEKKRELVSGRLAKRLRHLKLSTYKEYCELLESEDGHTELENMVNAITTNITNFFREPHHFTHLKDNLLIPLMQNRRSGDRTRVRIWSAGCSSGEEPYSIAMTVLDTLKSLSGWDFLILATDIDTNVLNTGQKGEYDLHKAGTLPDNVLKKHATPFMKGEREFMRMNDELRNMIRFKKLNLTDQHWPMKGPFDVIFCRNVTIYFNKEMQKRLFTRYADLLKPGGFFYLGHAESIIGMSDRFDVSAKTVYRLKA